jgi:DNA-directed RNA polymerase specialized sigma24 family protein
MNDVQTAAALRAGSPDALAELLDAYGDRLFRYCWCMLRNRDIAQVAVRDTLAVAQAHIARLADPESFGSWLYSLARAECRRRRPVPPAQADEPAARPSQHDADARLMAWRAAMGLDAAELEALELSCRHDVDLGLVLGLPGADAEALLGRARQNLERALGAEILVSRGHGCPGRARVLRGWDGTVPAELRERVLAHAARCPACGPHVPRNVSAARVFALLPAPVLPPLARTQMLEFFDDRTLAAYREFAVRRAAVLDESGFPVPPSGLAAAQARPAPQPPWVTPVGADGGRPRGRRNGALLAGVTAVAIAAAIASSALLTGGGAGPAASRPAAAAPAAVPAWSTAAPASAAADAGAPPGRGAGPGAGRGSALTASSPLLPPSPGNAGQVMITAVTRPAAPAARAAGPGVPASARASGGPSPARGTITVSPGSLALTPGGTGQVWVTAVGGPVAWTASTSSAQLALSRYSGTLRAGQDVTLEVTVSGASARGEAAVYVTAAGSPPQAVEVSWAPRPAPSRSPTSPSPSPTSPSPSPSPTSPSPSPSPTSPSPTSPSPTSPSPSASGSSSPASASPTSSPTPTTSPSSQASARAGSAPATARLSPGQPAAAAGPAGPPRAHAGASVHSPGVLRRARGHRPDGRDIQPVTAATPRRRSGPAAWQGGPPWPA